MTDADHAQTYEQRVQAIQLANQPILEGFETWLRQSWLREPTIKAHVDNMRFFSRYLLLYAYSLRRLDEATEVLPWDMVDKSIPFGQPTSCRFFRHSAVRRVYFHPGVRLHPTSSATLSPTTPHHDTAITPGLRASQAGTFGKGHESTSRVVHCRFVLPAAMAGVRCR